MRNRNQQPYNLDRAMFATIRLGIILLALAVGGNFAYVTLTSQRVNMRVIGLCETRGGYINKARHYDDDLICVLPQEIEVNSGEPVTLYGSVDGSVTAVCTEAEGCRSIR